MSRVRLGEKIRWRLEDWLGRPGHLHTSVERERVTDETTGCIFCRSDMVPICTEVSTTPAHSRCKGLGYESGGCQTVVAPPLPQQRQQIMSQKKFHMARITCHFKQEAVILKYLYNDCLGDQACEGKYSVPRL